MKLNLLGAAGAGTAWAGQGLPRAFGGHEESRPECLNPKTVQRAGSKSRTGDKRPKLSSTRAITHEYVHSYLINDAPSQEVPKTPVETMNPDVSGYVSQLCRDPPRNTTAGKHSLREALQELK